MPEILCWNEISADFQDGLLLGNGASIAVHPGFSYQSLYEQARKLGHFNEQVQEIFERFGTEDFELVLRRLWQAKQVNSALGIPHGRVEEAYEVVRGALIETVRETHVSYEIAAPHLRQIYKFLQGFKTVVSLNYDLIVYWATRLASDELGNWFKDCFNGAAFRDDWETLREPLGADGATLFFYPHGNLILTRTKNDSERKVRRAEDGNLLEEILDTWESEINARIPIFVCEGTTEQKRKFIESSAYLRTVFHEVIPKIGKSLAIYGWSFSDQDEHIFEQLRLAEITRVAVSVRNQNQAFARRIEGIFHEVGIQCVFYDSASPECWNNAA